MHARPCVSGGGGGGGGGVGGVAICTFPGKRASGLFFALTLLPRTVTRLPHKLLPLTLNTRILGGMADLSQKYPESIAFNLKRTADFHS